jgi:putative spermidine/putrescine transport system ATP-binding protein/putrescine transport system ATP-binding protein
MTVRDNVAFGLRHRGVPKGEIPQRVAEALALVQLSGLEARRPGQLSGGEQQRVALARALATRPTVLLLDEPLSNLDAKLRADVRIQMHAILEQLRTTTIMVTHDQDEAMSLADRIIVMSRGAIEQSGRPAEIYDAPRTRFVAEFIGRSNWLSGEIVSCANGLARFELDDGGSVVVSHRVADATQCFDICLRPERIAVMLAGAVSPIADAAAVNRLKGRVRHVEMLGPQLHLHVVLEGGRTMLALLPRWSAQDFTGAEVYLAFRPEDALLIPRTPHDAVDQSIADGDQAGQSRS